MFLQVSKPMFFKHKRGLDMLLNWTQPSNGLRFTSYYFLSNLGNDLYLENELSV